MNNWLDVAERRAEEIDAGLVELIPSEIVSIKAKALLNFQQAEKPLSPPKCSDPIKTNF